MKSENAPGSKRREEPTARVVAYLPLAIEMKLRLAATAERRSLSDAVTEAVNDWLGLRKKRSGEGRHPRPPKG